jgi:hypothetical protein
MKLNNKGFGMRETLIYLSILLLVLLIASCSISSFYDDLEESRNEEYVPSYGYDVDEEDESDDVVSDKEEDIVINYTPYYLAEARFKEAAENYANAYSLRDSLTTLKLEDVDKSGYLDETIVDAVDGSKCTGYANVTYEDKYGGIYDVDVYISCANYRTEGYR